MLLWLTAALAQAVLPRFVRRQFLPCPPGAEECTRMIVGLGTDATGNLYIADQAYGKIYKYSPSGTMLLEFGQTGTGAGQFQRVKDVTADASGNIYVCDVARHMVIKFNAAGQYVSEWGGEGPANGQFNQPIQIQCSADGRVFVNDSRNARIQIYSGEGTLLTTLPLPNSGANPPFCSAMAIDGSRLTTFDSANGNLTAMSVDSPHGGLTPAGGASIGSYTSLLLAVESLDNVPLILTTDRVYLRYFDWPGWGRPHFGEEPFSYRESMAVTASTRTVYLSNSAWGAVDVYQFDVPANTPDPQITFAVPSPQTGVYGQPLTITVETAGTGPLVYELSYTTPPHHNIVTVVQTGSSPTMTIPSLLPEHTNGAAMSVTVTGPFGRATSTFTINGVWSAAPVVIKSAALNQARTHFQLTAAKADNASFTSSEVSTLKLYRSPDLQNWTVVPAAPQWQTQGVVFTDTASPGTTSKMFWRVGP